MCGLRGVGSTARLGRQARMVDVGRHSVVILSAFANVTRGLRTISVSLFRLSVRGIVGRLRSFRGSYKG